MKNLRADKSKTSSHKCRVSEHKTEAFEKTCKDWKQKDQRYGREQKHQISYLTTTGVNTIEIKPGENQKKDSNQCRQNEAYKMSKIKYYNNKKLRYYTNKWLKSKNRFKSWLPLH